MKKLLVLLMVALLAMSFAGCTPEAVPDEPDTPDTPATTVSKVTMVTDTGGINDESFNQSAWEGLQSLMDKYPDVTFDYILSVNEADYAPNMRAAVENGSDLTWAVGYMLADAMAETVEAMPDAKFGIIDVNWLSGDNLMQYSFKEHESTLLAGIVAGYATKSNKVAFIGGMSGDLIKKFEVGFRAGVKLVNPDATIDVAYTESWSDVQKGKELASAFYDQGIDVIYHASGQCGLGVFQAATERGTGPEGFWAIGTDRDQHPLAPDNILTSVMKQVGGVMATYTEDFINGTFDGGSVKSLGLAEGAVGLVPSSVDTIPADIKDAVFAKIDEVTEQILNGDLVVPSTEAEFEAWTP